MTDCPLTLKVLTPEGAELTAACDHVNLFALDNAAGEGGGSVGVRRGHCRALIALAPGSSVTAKREGAAVKKVRVLGGFAMVRDDTVTVLTDSFEEES